jgi:hypothetical protein
MQALSGSSPIIRRLLTRQRRVAALLLSSTVGCLIIVNACVDSDFQSGRFGCDPPNGECPPGLRCAADGRCRTGDVPVTLEDGSIDGSVSDVVTSETGVSNCVESRWTLEVDARAPASVTTTDDGRVFAAGTIGNSGWIAEFDRCDGGLVREQSYGIMGSRTKFAAIAPAPLTNELVVSGTATSEAGATNTPVHGRFKAADLAQVALAAEGTGISSEATLIAVGKDGAQWMSGANATGGGGFIARVDAPTCTLPLTSRPGAIAIGSDGKLRVMREGPLAPGAPLDVIAGDCKNEGPGADPLAVGAGTVTPGGLVPILGDRLAATGTAQAANGTSFWIAKQQDDPKKWTVVSFDPNPADPDLGRSIAYDGEALFLGVSQRAVGATGTPTLYRFDVALTPMARQVWSASPFGPRLFDIRQIAVDKAGKDSIFVVATVGSSGAIARCTKAGQCP